MFLSTSTDDLTNLFRPYLPLHSKTIERTIRRMRLPVPDGMQEVPGGVRGSLLGDAGLWGTISGEVFRMFGANVTAGTLDPVGAEGWVVTTTRLATRTHAKPLARRLARYGSLFGADGRFLEHLVPCNDTPETLALAAAETRLVSALLAALPTADRELLVARFVDERPYEELAFTFGSTPSALRKRVERTLGRLRAMVPSDVGLAA